MAEHRTDDQTVNQAVKRSVYSALAEVNTRNEAAAFCVIVSSRGSTPRHTSSKMVVYPDGSIEGTVGGGELENRVIAEALDAIREGAPRLLKYNMADPSRGDPGVCGGQVEIFVDPVLPKPTLLVIGIGHVGQEVAHLAKWLGFHVVISDDRPEFSNQEVVPDADEALPFPMAEIPQHLKITPWTYIVLTTRGVDVDAAGLPALLNTEAAYIGVIGSRRRWETSRKKLAAAGLSDEQIGRVRSPIGLELNAETPREIAVSILAEIIMLRNGGDGSVMDAASGRKAAGG